MKTDLICFLWWISWQSVFLLTRSYLKNSFTAVSKNSYFEKEKPVISIELIKTDIWYTLPTLLDALSREYLVGAVRSPHILQNKYSLVVQDNYTCSEKEDKHCK